jgi:asparagine synthase (glutamine-hydrolysing)
MASHDGAHVIAFNGEIFNYVELRTELCALGHQFASSSDTEVLLNAWRQWGDDCVDRLDGMFAFVIWDRQKRELFGARDRFGIKPLYVYHGDDVVILASEIKAIQASGQYTARANWPVIKRYLVDGEFDESRSTCFDGIDPIEPAHSFRVGTSGRLKSRRYFTLPTELLDQAADGPHAIGEMLETAVQTRMRSDVPLGVCLSGGIDSTAIICAMARHRRATNDSSPLLAFNYNAAQYDEAPYLSETVRQTGAKLVSWEGKPGDLWNTFSRVLHFHDEPVHSMNVMVGFELMRLAREHGVLVILNGQGADETLGGYSSYFQDYWATLLGDGQVRDTWREINGFAGAFSKNPALLAMSVARTVALNAAGNVPGYALAARAWRHASRNHWFSSDVTRTKRGAKAPMRLQDTQRVAVDTSPLPLYLRIEDRNSMAHGVEARVPFLEHRLVSYALRLPLQSRINGPWNKHALREAVRGRIPEVVRTRVDKLGFPTPSGHWFARELHEPLRDLLSSRAARERGLYKTDNMLRALNTARGSEVVDHEPLFRAANVEMWLAMMDARAKA